MKIYIANFGNLKSLNENCIPISTAVYQPKFWTYGIDKNNVFLGISERELSPYRLDSDHICINCCPHKNRVPECPFLIEYNKYLATVDFNYIMSEFTRVSEDVRKVTSYVGEPNIVLLVYEAEDNPCSERNSLIAYFKSHGVEVNNWRK